MKQKQQFEWGLAGFGGRVKADAAVKEFKKVEKTYGGLTPENLLKASSAENALLHSLFTWDDTHAAHQYRLQQARVIINNIKIKIVSDGIERSLPFYEVIRKPDDGRVYKSVDVFDASELEQVKQRTVKDLNAMRSKLSIYKSLQPAVELVDQTIQFLETFEDS